MNEIERRQDSISGRDFGRLETEVIGLKAQNVRLESEIKELRDDVRTLLEAVTEAKGGWKMLLMIGSASAAIGASAAKMAAWFKGG
jgi:hypothetical protein